MEPNFTKPTYEGLSVDSSYTTYPGLTLARAIAEQHGGALALANRRGADGEVAGLTATLRLPLH